MPIESIKLALIKCTRGKQGIPMSHVKNIVEEKMRQAQKDPDYMAAVIRLLNKVRDQNREEARGRISDD